ncbi:MAG: virulence protein [Ruminococcus flavefaciens]|nr:virulence protein [Ruminococcus flavefaciens]
MTINYNVTGNERKRLADYIAGFLGSDKKYLGAPSFSYMVGYIEVSRNGAITFDDRADSKEIETLLEELEREGFHAEPAADSEGIAEGGEVSEEPANVAQGETVGLTVAIPLDKVNCGNLTSILDAKGSLIKKALGIDATPIEIRGDKVSFPWFSKMPDADETAAYTHFISALCGMSASQKRVTAKEKAVDNEKYAFRCFLLRLGFIGAEYKAERKILLRNLTGSSAFKSGAKKEADSDAVSE